VGKTRPTNDRTIILHVITFWSLWRRGPKQGSQISLTRHCAQQINHGSDNTRLEQLKGKGVRFHLRLWSCYGCQLRTTSCMTASYSDPGERKQLPIAETPPSSRIFWKCTLNQRRKHGLESTIANAKNADWGAKRREEFKATNSEKQPK